MVVPRLRSIRSKLILMFFAVAALPLLALGLATTILFGGSVERQNTDATLKLIAQVTRGIDANVRDMDYLIEFLSHDEAVVAFLSGHTASAPALNRILDQLRISRPDVAGLMVVNDADQVAGSNLDRVNRDALTQESWYQLALKTPQRVRLQARPVDWNVRNREGLSADDVVAVTKAVVDPVTGSPRGVILVDWKLSVLEGMFAQTSMADGGFLCVADGGGNFVWAPPVPVAYRLDPQWFAESGKSVVARIEDERYQILTLRSPYTGWDTIGVFSLTEALKEVIFLTTPPCGSPWGPCSWRPWRPCTFPCRSAARCSPCGAP
jgi:two-component system sensor histidine kinase YesM